VKPPLVLNSARVLYYAGVDGSVGYAGRKLRSVDGKELGRFLGLQSVTQAGRYSSLSLQPELERCGLLWARFRRGRQTKGGKDLSGVFEEAETRPRSQWAGSSLSRKTVGNRAL
jgi:hypothetical protein